MSLWSSAQVRKATPTCFRLQTQEMRKERAFAFESAGRRVAARIPTMAITTKSSTRLKPRFCTFELRIVVVAKRQSYSVFRSEFARLTLRAPQSGVPPGSRIHPSPDFEHEEEQCYQKHQRPEKPIVALSHI